MDYIIEEGEEFNLRNLTNLTEYKECQPVPIEFDAKDENLENIISLVIEKANKTIANKVGKVRNYMFYTDDQKTLFLYYLKIKFFSAAKAAEYAGIAERTAQTWAKRIRTEPDWNIYEKQTNIGNRAKSQLQEPQNLHILELFDNKPYITTDEVVDSLTKAFEGFTLKKSTVNGFILHECNLTIKRLQRQPKARNDPTRIDARYEWVIKYDNLDIEFLQSCIFIDESGFDINMRPSYGRSVSGAPAITSTPSAKAESHSILGAIATVGVVNVDVRVPQMNKRIKVAGGRKRKPTNIKKKPGKKGATAGHYLNFLRGILDQLDKYPESKGFYLVTDNAPVHNHEEIETLITNRGYRCVYLPPYFPELNPIEQFWSLVKNRVKRSKFNDKEYLFTRIRDACTEVPREIITKSVEHSVEALEKCRNKQPL